MDQLHGIIYPITYPGLNVRARLAQVFDRISVLVPVEDIIPDVSAEGPPGLDMSFIASSPLGERLSWFNGFMKSIIGWGQEMGLGTAINAQSVLEASLSEDESTLSIMKAMKKDVCKDALLEAQVFLRLAHEFDQREDELGRVLGEIEMKENVLGGILHGPVSGSYTPGSEVRGPAIAPLSMPLKRLSAWYELWQRYKGPAGWPVGIGIDVKDLMDKAYEKIASAPATDIVCLKLPPDPSIRPGTRPEIRQGLTELIKAVSSQPQKALQEVMNNLSSKADELSQQWLKLTDGLDDGPTLALGIYPGVSFVRLVPAVSGKAHDLAPGGKDVIGWSFYLY